LLLAALLIKFPNANYQSQVSIIRVHGMKEIFFNQPFGIAVKDLLEQILDAELEHQDFIHIMVEQIVTS